MQYRQYLYIDFIAIDFDNMLIASEKYLLKL